MLSGCITEYTPSDIDELANLLVVEGNITEGESVIKLSRSVGINDDTYNIVNVQSATVQIESNDGAVYSPSEVSEKGEYKFYIETLDTNLKYRLRIKVDNEEYESTFRQPLMTPPIDSLSFIKESKSSPINICVTTHGAKEQSRYYLWSYREIWETRANIYAQLGYVNGVLVEYNDITPNPAYYCWKYNNSNSLLLGSSDKLNENKIENKRLIEVDAADDRFSELYYIELKQISLSKEAFDYFTNLQKNIESTGSIFGPIPSEMQGNILCISGTHSHAIGYLEVSKTVIQKTYVPKERRLYEPPIVDCVTPCAGDEIYQPESNSNFAPIYRGGSCGLGLTYSYVRCIDCRLSGGTKNRPDFWPNDHK